MVDASVVKGKDSRLTIGNNSRMGPFALINVDTKTDFNRIIEIFHEGVNGLPCEKREYAKIEVYNMHSIRSREPNGTFQVSISTADGESTRNDKDMINFVSSTAHSIFDLTSKGDLLRKGDAAQD